MRTVTIVGARPQFVKAFVLSRALAARGSDEEILVHTGQHYDYAMSGSFFDQLGLKAPDYNLGVGSGSHGAQTGAMLAAIEDVLLEERPDVVVVYGDTNSTLAGALAAAKLHIPIAHVEAGLRSFRRDMPEELNRLVADRMSDLLFAPTRTAVENLAAEGILEGVHCVGDVMFDAVLLMRQTAANTSVILDQHALTPGDYGLATIHRAANTDDPERLWELISVLGELDRTIVFPMHPRTGAALASAGHQGLPANLIATAPVGYLDMLMLEQHARCILTDSGGVQKEAYFFGVPCVTLREETEWVETLSGGWNTLAGFDRKRIEHGWMRPRPDGAPEPVFGHGDAGTRIAAIVHEYIGRAPSDLRVPVLEA